MMSIHHRWGSFGFLHSGGKEGQGGGSAEALALKDLINDS